MKILVINGPNMNMLGIRQPEIYGHATYEDLKSMIAGEAERLGVGGLVLPVQPRGRAGGRHSAGVL